MQIDVNNNIRGCISGQAEAFMCAYMHSIFVMSLHYCMTPCLFITCLFVYLFAYLLTYLPTSVSLLLLLLFIVYAINSLLSVVLCAY